MGRTVSRCPYESCRRMVSTFDRPGHGFGGRPKKPNSMCDESHPLVRKMSGPESLVSSMAEATVPPPTFGVENNASSFGARGSKAEENASLAFARRVLGGQRSWAWPLRPRRSTCLKLGAVSLAACSATKNDVASPASGPKCPPHSSLDFFQWSTGSSAQNKSNSTVITVADLLPCRTHPDKPRLY